MKSVHPRAAGALSLFQLMVLLFVALLATVSPARAEWFAEDVGWVRLNASNVGNPNNSADTLWTTFAASKVDTSAEFTWDNADNPSTSLLNKVSATADSLVLGCIRIYSDSTVASTVSFKTSTCKIQINYGKNAANWQDLVTYTSSQGDGLKHWNVPVFLQPISPALIDRDAGYGLESPMTLFGARLRVIVTGSASVAGPAMRIATVKWSDDMRKREGER